MSMGVCLCGIMGEFTAAAWQRREEMSETNTGTQKGVIAELICLIATSLLEVAGWGIRPAVSF